MIEQSSFSDDEPTPWTTPNPLDETYPWLLDGGMDFEIPQIDIDFDVIPDVPSIHEAFALGKPLNLLTKGGETVTFKLEADLGNSGWLDKGVEIDTNGNVDVSRAPNYAYYQGIITQRGSYAGRYCFPEDHWVIYIDPESGLEENIDVRLFSWKPADPDDMLRFC